MSTPARDHVRERYASFHRKPLTIQNWLGGASPRVGELLVNTKDGSVHVNFIGSQDSIVPLGELKAKHLEPSGDGFTVAFADYNDPA